MSETCTQTECTNPGCRVHNPPPPATPDALRNELLNHHGPGPYSSQAMEWQTEAFLALDAACKAGHLPAAWRHAVIEAHIKGNADYATQCAKHEREIAELEAELASKAKLQAKTETELAERVVALEAERNTAREEVKVAMLFNGSKEIAMLRAVVDAAHSLERNLYGMLGAYEADLRSIMGNTNYAVLRYWSDTVRKREDALAATEGKAGE